MAIVKAKEAYSCQKFEMKTFLVTDRLWMVSKYKNINEIICDDSEGEKKKKSYVQKIERGTRQFEVLNKQQRGVARSKAARSFYSLTVRLS